MTNGLVIEITLRMNRLVRVVEITKVVRRVGGPQKGAFIRREGGHRKFVIGNLQSSLHDGEGAIVCKN
jgi:hypothetical protein